jgi:hypothetical protein
MVILEDIIKIYFKEAGGQFLYMIHLVQDRVL